MLDIPNLPVTRNCSIMSGRTFFLFHGSVQVSWWAAALGCSIMSADCNILSYFRSFHLETWFSFDIHCTCILICAQGGSQICVHLFHSNHMACIFYQTDQSQRSVWSYLVQKIKRSIYIIFLCALSVEKYHGLMVLDPITIWCNWLLFLRTAPGHSAVCYHVLHSIVLPIFIVTRILHFRFCIFVGASVAFLLSNNMEFFKLNCTYCRKISSACLYSCLL